jgi:hypothetical protein
MGLLDSLFGKKITVRGEDENGNPFRKQFSLKKFQEWKDKQGAVEVEILDPRGHRTAFWKIGEGITANTVKRFKDPETNKLYAFTIYKKDGEPITRILLYADWLEFKRRLNEDIPEFRRTHPGL